MFKRISLIVLLTFSTTIFAYPWRSHLKIVSALGVAASFMSSYNYYEQLREEKDLIKECLLKSYYNDLMSTRNEVLKYFSYLKINKEVKEEMLPLLTVLYELSKGDFYELKEKYDFEGNTELEKARVILLAENHSSKEIILNNFRLIKKMIRPGDVVLTESSMSFDVFFSWVLIKLLPKELNDIELEKQMELFKTFKSLFNSEDILFSNIIETGWDVFREQDNYQDAVQDLLLNANKHLEVRNVGLEKTLQKLSCRRIFVIAGVFHLPLKFSYIHNEEFHQESIAPSLAKIASVLNQYPHTLASLKNFHLNSDENKECVLFTQEHKESLNKNFSHSAYFLVGAFSTLCFLSFPKASLAVVVLSAAMGSLLLSSDDSQNEDEVDYSDQICPNSPLIGKD